jgi:hypothetical protein
MRSCLILAIFGLVVTGARADLPKIQSTGPIRISLPTRATQPYPMQSLLARRAADSNWNRYAFGTPAYYYCGYGYGCGYHGCLGSGNWPYGVLWGYSIW